MDTINTGATSDGNDIVLGGHEGDFINVYEGDNIVLGDDGAIDYVIADGNASDIDLILSLSTTAFGGVDDIDSGSGDDILIGGRFGDTIDSLGGNNLVIGDSGIITAANEDAPNFSDQPITIGRIETIEFGDGGIDTINTGSISDGNDIVLGGHLGDTINVGEGDNIVLGDDGAIDYVREERDGDVPGADADASDIDLILSLSTTDGGGADDIDSGSGDDIIIGGRFGDIIDAGDGDNLVFGDSGEITAAQADTTRRGSQPLTLMTLGRIKTTEYADGGADDITTGDGSDIVLGGISGNEANGDDGDPDVIRSGAGADIVLGDNGTLIYDEAMSPDPATLDQVTTTQPTDGGADEIYGGSGNDFIFGGTGGDKIYGDNGSGPDQDLDGNDLIFGDHGLVSGIVLAVDIGVANARFSYDAIDTLEENLGGDDLLYGNGGLNIILGQQGSDKIYGGDNDDDLIGGHNVPDGYDGADFIDGGAGNDVILGDNGSILRSASATDPRFTVLEGTQIYNDNSFALVEDGNSIGANPAGVEARRILLFDHDNSAANNGNFGDDTIAGGADDDVIFGQLGDDQIHGDGLLDGTTLVTLTATITGSDIGGDDYIEGNGGSDLIYGGLGQDDIVGGSSNLYNLNDSSMRPDADDTIFGGNGDLIGRNNYGVVDLSGNVVEEAHARDSDMILGDNGNIFRLVGINGEDSSIFLSFNYDNYSDAQKIVVRAAQLLDYTPGGFDYDASKADKDIGAGRHHPR